MISGARPLINSRYETGSLALSGYECVRSRLSRWTEFSIDPSTPVFVRQFGSHQYVAPIGECELLSVTDASEVPLTPIGLSPPGPVRRRCP
jgi:hypothetical protein